MEKRQAICEGKAKILYTTGDADKIIQFFKDDAIMTPRENAACHLLPREEIAPPREHGNDRCKSRFS